MLPASEAFAGMRERSDIVKASAAQMVEDLTTLLFEARQFEVDPSRFPALRNAHALMETVRELVKEARQ